MKRNIYQETNNRHDLVFIIGLILLLALAFYENIYAQISFQEHSIKTNANAAMSVYAVDIDGDSDIDVLSVSMSNHKVIWFENTDGLGTFSSEIIISSNAQWANSVYAADFDGDGDQDVLTACEQDDRIVWYKNTDGKGTFDTEHIITTNVNDPMSVFAVDIDRDGDIDVLSASKWDNKIAWYKNTDGLGTFGAQQIITTSAEVAMSVYAVDIDGDGDIDVLSASLLDNKIAWYENTDGLGTFSTQQIITTDAEGAMSVYAVDIDGDGDQDVLSASRTDEKIAWYKNIDGQGTFGTQQVVLTNSIGAETVYAADIDGDNNQDVISSSNQTNKIVWNENTDGQGAFVTHQINTTNQSRPMSLFAIDIDGDGDQDILCASYYDITWYENQGTLSINQNQLSNFSTYPNPTTGLLTINSETAISQLEIYNLLGQLVYLKKNENSIDISNLNQGIYIVKIQDEEGNIGSKKLIKK